MGTFGLHQMQDNAVDDRPVLLPDANQPHAFQQSSDHYFLCDLCYGRRGKMIHDSDEIKWFMQNRERNIANERARQARRGR